MAIMTQQISFMKMHGLGNDFVIVDSRGHGPVISAEIARGLGNRHLGVGFDQLAVISDSPQADVALTFFNADGSTAGACGNATRCVAQYEMQRLGRKTLSLITERGDLACASGGRFGQRQYGPPIADWDEVPLAREMETLHCRLRAADGNWHGQPALHVFCRRCGCGRFAAIGPKFEHHPLFPERTNVQFAHVSGEPSDACGSGSAV